MSKEHSRSQIPQFDMREPPPGGLERLQRSLHQYQQKQLWFTPGHARIARSSRVLVALTLILCVGAYVVVQPYPEPLVSGVSTSSPLLASAEIRKLLGEQSEVIDMQVKSNETSIVKVVEVRTTVAARFYKVSRQAR